MRYYFLLKSEFAQLEHAIKAFTLGDRMERLGL
jgi:hypothetical protein